MNPGQELARVAGQDHLKAVFAKTDTRSQRELLTQVCFHDQLPGIVAHDPLNAGGHLQSAEVQQGRAKTKQTPMRGVRPCLP